MKTWLIVEIFSLSDFVYWLGIIFIFYLFFFTILILAVKWFDLTFFHPLDQFLNLEIKKVNQVQLELENYSRWMKIILIHSLSLYACLMVFLVYHQVNYPVYIAHSKFRIILALRKSFFLQADKYLYFKNLVNNDFRVEQEQTLAYTQWLLEQVADLVTYCYINKETQIESLNYYYGSLFLLFLFLLFLLVFSIFTRKSSIKNLFPMALVIPSSQGLPGWFILKLAYPFVFLGLVSYGWYRWKRSKISFAEFVTHKILTDPSCAISVVSNLKQYRYYLVATVLGGNIILILNWFIFAASLASYRFKALGIENLINFKTDFTRLKEVLTNRKEDQEVLDWADRVNKAYLELIDKLHSLDKLLTPLYEQEVDPVRRTLVVTFNSFIIWFVFIVYGWGFLLFNSISTNYSKKFQWGRSLIG